MRVTTWAVFDRCSSIWSSHCWLPRCSAWRRRHAPPSAPPCTLGTCAHHADRIGRPWLIAAIWSPCAWVGQWVEGDARLSLHRGSGRRC